MLPVAGSEVEAGDRSHGCRLETGRLVLIVGDSRTETTTTIDTRLTLELADHVAELPCLPYVEHFRHHMQLNSGVLMFTKAVVLITFNGVDILNVPLNGDG